MFGLFYYVLSFTNDIFNGQYISTSPEHSLSQQVFKADVANDWDWVTPMGAAPPYSGIKIGSRKEWIVTCGSEQDEDHDCKKAIDGDRETHWLTSRNSITVDLGATRNVNGLAVLPRQDDNKEGNIATHEIYLSVDGTNWDTPVAYGTWWTDNTGLYATRFEHVIPVD